MLGFDVLAFVVEKSGLGSGLDTVLNEDPLSCFHGLAFQPFVFYSFIYIKGF